MAVPGPPASSTRQQQVAYYAGLIQEEYPGTYQGNQTAYTGMTFSQLFKTLAQQNPQYSAQQLAGVVVDAAAAQKLGTGLQAASNELGTFSATAEKAVASTNFGAGVPGLTGLTAIGQFFNDLRDPSFWLRLGKIVGGSLILIIGLLKLTGVSEKAGSIAGKAVKVAPFL